jgi:Chromosome segregation ATPases
VTIERFRLQGFKSFAEQTEVVIGRGMTGIVGPNGCGKSNLIEALRWGVGETAYKSMRAENGMEDLIFAGTQTRPPRNSAEVVITMDNSAKIAPAEFNSADTLEISRRMERGDGSSYRINGKPALARDVQVLFKDAGFGAKSSAIVSQGKVSSIINTKPSERRSILDEAAGTAGLATRRHEADMRLRGTEQNLERAEALEKGLSDQLGSLRKQARQAARRREMDSLIRKAEATAFLVRWRAAASRIATSTQAHEANEGAIKEMMISLQSSAASLAEVEAMAAPLTKARSDAETAVALARVAVDTVRREANAARSALQAAQKNASRTELDLDRERNAIAEINVEYENLKDQLTMAEDDRQYDAVLIEEAAAVAEEAKAVLDEATVALEAGNAEHVRAATERKALTERLTRDIEQERSTTSKLLQARNRIEQIKRSLSELPKPSSEIEDLSSQVADLAIQIADAEARHSEAREKEAQARSLHDLAKGQEALLEGEAKALRASVPTNSLSSLLAAEDGLEEALAIALGDGTNAQVGIEGDKWWSVSDVRVTPPKGTTPLARHITVPKEIEAAVSGVGVAADEKTAEQLSASLEAGQAIVTKDGRIWRWDGFRSSTNASAAEEIRRTQRLRKLETEIGIARTAVEQTARTLESARILLADTALEEKTFRDAEKTTRARLEALRKVDEDAIRRRAELEAQFNSAQESEANLVDEVAAAVVRREEAENALQDLPRQDLAEATLATLRRQHAEASRSYENERSKLEKARREADTRNILIQTLTHRATEYDKRLTAARATIADLTKRANEIADEIKIHEENVAIAPEREAEALGTLEEAVASHEAAVEAARESEARLADLRVSTRTLELQLAERRERRATVLAEIKAFNEAATELSREIQDRLNCAGDTLAEVAGIETDAELPELEACEARIQRLHRERETLGTVNLLADEQLKEVEHKLGEANKVRDELREAVRRLRDSIAKFDRERRERLTEAFAQLDTNFQDLFTRLFHGGQAYLKLSGSDDILEAGLEIYAAPPGKKMQSMSLLSGGEQALTALAMIFAAFLIRPAPVCILDEVDAALDDANVDRMCALVTDMAKEATRFLVITHRALTMARCDRLYGVTMAERGVSRLTSLNMDEAVAFVESFEPVPSKD